MASIQEDHSWKKSGNVRSDTFVKLTQHVTESERNVPGLHYSRSFQVHSLKYNNLHLDYQILFISSFVQGTNLPKFLSKPFPKGCYFSSPNYNLLHLHVTFLRTISFTQRRKHQECSLRFNSNCVVGSSHSCKQKNINT